MAMVASEVSSGADGSFSFSSTVSGSVAVMVSTAARRLASGEAMSLASTRLSDATTSAASTGAPLWNVTPGRILKV